MSEALWIGSHVRMLLQDLWGRCRVEVDDDGDFPFRSGSARGWVTITRAEPVLVEVFAHAAVGVSRTATLLSELNEVQRGSVSARVHLLDDTIVVSQTVSPRFLTLPVLAQAVDEVSRVAADIGPLFAAFFDGATPYPSPVSADERSTPP